MDRNSESYFANVPSINTPRSIFHRNNKHITTCNVGDLIPVYCSEILPGDSVEMTSSKVIRLQTLLTPLMDNIFADMYWFFVPMRLTWDHTKEFFGEASAGPWAPTTEYRIPKIHSPAGGFAFGSIADYMGIPPKVDFSSSGIDPNRLPSALPFRAYAMICDEFFRSEVVTNPLNIYKGDADSFPVGNEDYISGTSLGLQPFRVARYHDYFSSALIDAQKGNPVAISPIDPGLKWPVYSTVEQVPAYTGAAALESLAYRHNNNIRSGFVTSSVHYSGRDGDKAYVATSSGGSPTTALPEYFRAQHVTAEADETKTYGVSNLWAIPSGSLGSVTISDLRTSLALQAFLEKDALYGSKYDEYLLGHFGLSNPDARLQKPEYLGGSKINISISQVTATAATSAGSEEFRIGDTAGQSVTHDVNADFFHSFTEHGFLIGLICLRYEHSYSQGLDKFWTRTSRYDFYDPLFNGLSAQPLYTDEIYYDPTSEVRNVFGFQEYAAEYRFAHNQVSSEMRPAHPQTLASWHLGDYYTEAPTLSDNWMRESKAPVDRALGVTSAIANQALMDLWFDAKFTRPMPMYSLPGSTNLL